MELDKRSNIVRLIKRSEDDEVDKRSNLVRMIRYAYHFVQIELVYRLKRGRGRSSLDFDESVLSVLAEVRVSEG